MAIASKIKAAIDAGYSIDEIEQHLVQGILLLMLTNTLQ